VPGSPWSTDARLVREVDVGEKQSPAFILARKKW